MSTPRLVDIIALTEVGRTSSVFADLPPVQEDTLWKDAVAVSQLKYDDFWNEIEKDKRPTERFDIWKFKVEVAEVMVAFFEMFISNPVPHKEDLLKQRIKKLTEWKNFRDQFKPASPASESAPSLTGHEIIDHDEKEKWIDVEKKNRKEKKKSKSALKVAHPKFTAVEPSENGSVTSLKAIPIGEDLWTDSVRPSALVWVPPIKGLFFEGERVKSKDFSKVLASKAGKWEIVEEEGWYDAHTLDAEQLKVLADRGLIPENRLISLAAVAAKDNAKAFAVTFDDSFSNINKLAIQTAKVAYFNAQAEKLVNSKIPGKKNWVKTWYTRLTKVPLTIDPVPVAEKLTARIRMALKGDAPFSPQINKLLHSFMMGNLATWKQGQTKKDFLEQTEKARRYWWGSQADQYLTEFLLLPASAYNIRPKTSTLGKAKAATTKTVAALPAATAAAASSTKKTVLEVGRSALNKVKEAVKSRELDTIQGAKFYGKVKIEQIKNKLHGGYVHVKTWIGGDEKNPSKLKTIGKTLWGWTKAPWTRTEQTPGGPVEHLSFFEPFKKVYRGVKSSGSWVGRKFILAIRWLGWNFNHYGEEDRLGAPGKEGALD